MRTSTTFIGAVALCSLHKQNPLSAVPKELMAILIVRCFSGAIAFILVTKVLHLVPLTIFQSMSNVTPFISGFLACVWLGERLSLFQIFAMLCCFAGITIITISDDSNHEHPHSDQIGGIESETPINTSSIDSYQLGIFLILVVIMLFAVSAVTTRRFR